MKPPPLRFTARFFWQLILAFVLVILLMYGGMMLAMQLAFGADGATPLSTLWSERLSAYHAGHDGWQGVSEMMAEYPIGQDWAPWDQTWQVEYVLADGNGLILSAADSNRVGERLNLLEQAVAVPISEDGRTVGSLIILTREDIGVRLNPGRLLAMGLAIAGIGLVVAVVFSRRITKPLTDLTKATQAVAGGDLGVRVTGRYAGEAGELIDSFNRMAGDLALADEMRRNLTADVTHELRTPLAVMRAKLEGILDGVYPPTPEQLQPVLETVNLLGRLVEDLRLLALAEANQLVLDKKPVEIRDVLQDTIVNFDPQAADRGVSLKLEESAAMPPVPADRRRLAQIMGNLVDNALRYTPKGGSITLAARKKDSGWCEITVADTGSGIPTEDLPFVFERFWRGEKSRTRATGGSGLGLAIVKQLVELHGGRVHVESDPGKGSTFTVCLPTKQESSQNATSPVQ
jgi:signal transduction histidine kinase